MAGRTTGGALMNEQQIKQLYRRCYIHHLRPLDKEAADALSDFMKIYGIHQELTKNGLIIEARQAWHDLLKCAQKVSDCFNADRILGGE
jgi:hypothetical protein